MAELLNRIARERELEKLIKRMNKERAKELAVYLETAESLADVPKEFWDKVCKDIEDEDSAMAILLILMFEESADQHAQHIARVHGKVVSPAIIKRAGQSYVKRRLRQIAPGYVKHSKDMVKTAIREMRDSGGPDKYKIGDAIQKIFGDRRAKTVADTESNLSQNHGGDFAVKRSGIEVIAFWSHSRLRPPQHANAPKNPCPVCSPMEGKPAQEWGELYPGMAHPNCDCGISYVDRYGNIIGDPHDSDTLDRFRVRLPSGWLIENPLKESEHDVSNENRDDHGRWSAGYATHQKLAAAGIGGRKSMSFDDYVAKSKKDESDAAESQKRNGSGLSNQSEVNEHLSSAVSNGIEVKRAGRPDLEQTDYLSDNPEEKGSIPIHIRLSDGTKTTANVFFEIKDGNPTVTDIDSDSIRLSPKLRGLMKSGGLDEGDHREQRDNISLNSALLPHGEKLMTPEITAAINKERIREKNNQIRDSK